MRKAVTLVNAIILGFPSLSRNDPAVAPRKRPATTRRAFLPLSLSFSKERRCAFHFLGQIPRALYSRVVAHRPRVRHRDVASRCGSLKARRESHRRQGQTLWEERRPVTRVSCCELASQVHFALLARRKMRLSRVQAHRPVLMKRRRIKKRSRRIVRLHVLSRHRHRRDRRRHSPPPPLPPR